MEGGGGRGGRHKSCRSSARESLSSLLGEEYSTVLESSCGTSVPSLLHYLMDRAHHYAYNKPHPKQRKDGTLGYLH